jgi:hypothetical protein
MAAEARCARMGRKTGDETTGRKQRLAEKLRANLKRRKEQARARRPDEKSEGGQPGTRGREGR